MNRWRTIVVVALGGFLALGLLGNAPTAARGADGWLAHGSQANANLGREVAAAGDVNGDGYPDLLASDLTYNGTEYVGHAYLYYGSATGLSTAPDWSAGNDQPGSGFATRIAAAGDVNGDGYDDVLVGAPLYDHTLSDEGRAYLYYGSARGLSATPGWTADGADYVSYFSDGLAGVGDVNGDGYDDVVAGATYWTDPVTGDWGRVSLYLGSASGLSSTPAWTTQGNPIYGSFAAPVNGAGDVNGDGYDDFLVGAPYESRGESQEGVVYLYLGGPGGPDAGAVWTAEGNQAHAHFGNAIGSAGDVNGDGYGDVTIGAWYYDNGTFSDGRAYVYRGGAAGLGSAPSWTGAGTQYLERFGASVTTAGDVNGDGYDDLLVGADAFSNGQLNEGRLLLYAGGAGGLASMPLLTVEGDQEKAFLGASVAGLGDVNGDGLAEFAAGAPQYDWAATDDGVIVALNTNSASPLPTPAPTTPTPTPPPPTPTPTPSGTMHVADLDASSASAGKYWTASVTVQIVTGAGDPLSGAQIRGIWTRNGAGIGVSTCTTGTSGSCNLSKGNLQKRVHSVTFQVDTVTHATYTYNAAANNDPDGDSNGTTIVIPR